MAEEGALNRHPLHGHLDGGESIVKPTLKGSVLLCDRKLYEGQLIPFRQQKDYKNKEATMKVMQRGIMKVAPGKLAEAMELNQKLMALSSRHGMPTKDARMYRPFTGGGDAIHTVVFEMEWDSLTEMAAFFEKIMADPEWQAQMTKWDVLLDTHEVELYAVM
jgi:hypothetical protein